MDTFDKTKPYTFKRKILSTSTIMDGMEEVMLCRYTERGLLSTPHLLSCFMALSEDLDIVKWFIQLVPFYFHTNCAAKKTGVVSSILQSIFSPCLTNDPINYHDLTDGWRIMIKMIQYQTKPWRQPMLNINRQTDPQNIVHLTGLQRHRKVVLCIQWHYLSSNEM